MACTTKEQLIADYQMLYEGVKIPEGLYPAARERFEQELADIKNRGAFKMTVVYPEALSEPSKALIKTMLESFIDGEIMPMIKADLAGRELPQRRAMEFYKAPALPDQGGVALVDYINGVKLSTSLDLNGETGEHGRASFEWAPVDYLAHL